MEQDFNTPQRQMRDGKAARRSTSRPAQTPQQLSVLRESNPARSPAPRFPGSTSPGSAQRTVQMSHQEVSSQPRNAQQQIQPPPQQQQHQHQPDSFRCHERRNQHNRNSSSGGRGGEGKSGQGSAEPAWRQRSGTASGTISSQGSRPRRASPSGNSPDEDRRRCQRDKQINFGYVTDGYVNMERLIRHDPLLKSGGLLPLSPPTIVKGSKRLWDIQLRKWRRALHMFDYVFIDGEDDPATAADVLEEQRQQWVSEAFQNAPRDARKRIPLDVLRRVQHTAAVPTKLPVEEDLRCILRSDDCYESVRSVVPQSASSLTKGTDISPLEAGIKIHIAPSSAVLQRQLAQQELQQRLTSLQQQQHQQQSQSQSQPATERSAEPAGRTTPTRHCSPPLAEAATAQTQSSVPHRGEAPSPSPRRPQLSSPATTQTTDSMLTTAAPLASQPHHQTSLYPHQSSGSLNAGRMPAESITKSTTDGGDLPARVSCGARGFPLSSSTLRSGTAGASTSQPSGGCVLSEHSMWRNMELQTRPSPPTTASAVLAAPPPFPGVVPSHNMYPCPPPMAAFPITTPSYFTSGLTSGVPMPWGDHRAAEMDATRLAFGLTQHAQTGGGGETQPFAAPGAPWLSPPMFVDPVALNMPMAMMPIMVTAQHAGSNAPATMWETVQPNRLTASLSPPQFSTITPAAHVGYPRSRERQSAEAHTPTAGQMRDNARRGSVGTPQTIPRFVARLASSPSERRLGEQPQPSSESERGSTGVARTDTSPSPSRGGAHGISEHGSANSPSIAVNPSEQSRSFAEWTPERSLFGSSTAVAAGTGAEGRAKTEARPVQLRDHSAEKDVCEASGKELVKVSSEHTMAEAFDSHMETA